MESSEARYSKSVLGNKKKKIYKYFSPGKNFLQAWIIDGTETDIEKKMIKNNFLLETDISKQKEFWKIKIFENFDWVRIVLARIKTTIKFCLLL